MIVKHLENLTHLLKAVQPFVGLQRVTHTKLTSKGDFPISDPEGSLALVELEDNLEGSEKKAVPKSGTSQDEQFDEIVRLRRAYS